MDIEGIFVVCSSQRRRLWQVCELDLHLQLFSPLWNNDVQVSVFYLKESVSESRVSPCYILNVQESEKRGQITVLLACGHDKPTDKNRKHLLPIFCDCFKRSNPLVEGSSSFCSLSNCSFSLSSSCSLSVAPIEHQSLLSALLRSRNLPTV